MSEWRPYMGPALGPFYVEIRRECAFTAKASGRGCADCGKTKLHPVHLGVPPSINETAGKDRFTYLRVKEAWHRVLAEALVASQLPRGLESVFVEVLLRVPQYREQDEGNRRWLLEKALGDTLVGGYVRSRTVDGKKVKEQVIEGGWLVDDSAWPTLRYSMGRVAFEHTPGEASILLGIFPSCELPVRAPRHGERESGEVLF